MRMSCNGCRVLRKGCSDDCSIRPCLDWIKTPDSQAHATVFLAKFYGRAGLMNLVNAGPQHLRPAIFRSLLYEACGRIVNPIYGSVGLLWSGSWQLCQNAVEAVLKGVPITQIPTDAAENKTGPPLKAYDIRHVNREDNLSGSSNDLHRVRNRFRFKRDGAKPRRSRVRVRAGSAGEVRRSPSHESSLSHQSEEAAAAAAETNVEIENTARESESLASAENAEAACGSASEDEGEIELDLTLGFEPFKRAVKPKEVAVKEAEDDGGAGLCKMELRLDCAVRGFNGSD
ncbi:hypothetical protein ACP275_08G073700 [Erythranthe tilingii]